jgi:plastocyanin
MAQHQVVIKRMKYTPDPVVVKAGDSITWRNEDGMEHTATANDKSFDTGLLAKDETSAPVPAGKTTAYHCTEHPSMKGTVRVE